MAIPAPHISCSMIPRRQSGVSNMTWTRNRTLFAFAVSRTPIGSRRCSSAQAHRCLRPLPDHTYISERKVAVVVERIEPREEQGWRDEEERCYRQHEARKELQAVEEPASEQAEITAHRLDGIFAKTGGFEQVRHAVSRIAKEIVRRLVHFPFM